MARQSKSRAPRRRGGFVDELHHFGRGLGAAGEEGFVGDRLDRDRARGRIVVLRLAHEFQRDRMGDLQGELLAQVALDDVLAAAVAAHQLGHQVGRVGDAGLAQRRLDRRQDMALHDAQENIVARHVEAFAELLLGEQRDRGAGALQPVGVEVV